MLVALYIVGVFAALFVISGVLPTYLTWSQRGPRVEAFDRHYRAYLDARQRDAETSINPYGPSPLGEKSTELRAWLSARRNEMQRDAESVGTGVVYVAPPPAVGGGGYVRHDYFSDLFGQQSFTDYPPTLRLDNLATIRHEVALRCRQSKSDLFKPWRWAQLSFERVVRVPRYILRLAGFTKAAESTAARAVTVVWSILVGASTIGAFVVALIALLTQSH